MKTLSILVALFSLFVSDSFAAEPKIVVDEKFTGKLSSEWRSGKGTWTAKEGVLRAVRSSEKGHGTTKVRNLPPNLKDAVIEFEFRLEGKAESSGINFGRRRGHLVHVIFAKDNVRVIAHQQDDKKVDLVRQKNQIAVGEWHRAIITFAGSTMSVKVDETTFTMSNDCLAEEKHHFSFCGGSGAMEGENAGALEFRKLIVTTP